MVSVEWQVPMKYEINDHKSSLFYKGTFQNINKSQYSLLTPLASLFCRKAECPTGPLPNIAFGNFALSFASSSFSNSLG